MAFEAELGNKQVLGMGTNQPGHSTGTEGWGEALPAVAWLSPLKGGD